MPAIVVSYRYLIASLIPMGVATPSRRPVNAADSLLVGEVVNGVRFDPISLRSRSFEIVRSEQKIRRSEQDGRP